MHFRPCLFTKANSSTVTIRLALDLAEKHGVSLPTSAAANTLYVKALEQEGLGDEDFSAVYKAVNK